MASNISTCIVRATGSLRPLGNEALWRVADVLLLKQIAGGPRERGAGIYAVCGGGVVSWTGSICTPAAHHHPAARHDPCLAPHALIKDKRLAVDSPTQIPKRARHCYSVQGCLQHPGRCRSLDPGLLLLILTTWTTPAGILVHVARLTCSLTHASSLSQSPGLCTRNGWGTAELGATIWLGGVGKVGCRGGAATKDGTSSGVECTERRRRGGGGGREEGNISSAGQKRTQSLGRSGGQRASERYSGGLSVPFIFRPTRRAHPDQRASVADTHGRYGGRSLPAFCPALAP